ncbi:MAG: hypothetical protein NC820_06445 [Candidatus Omnitrophica bacterium]|nr:hypothetical protein [Candidatus Omnitrophota bacterium]
MKPTNDELIKILKGRGKRGRTYIPISIKAQLQGRLDVLEEWKEYNSNLEYSELKLSCYLMLYSEIAKIKQVLEK